MQSRWEQVTESKDVRIENGMVVRATKNNGTLPASVYRWDKRSECYVNACPIKYTTFRKGYESGKYTIL